MTEGPLSRPRRPRQEVRVATGAWQRPGKFQVSTEHFSVATENFMSLQSVAKTKGPCVKTKQFYVAT